MKEPLFPISYPKGNAWYVIRTEPKSEFRVREALKSRGYGVFLPFEKVWIRHARRKEERTKPLFPRYLFVSLDIDRAWTPILQLDGVKALLCSANGIPCRVPTPIIEKLIGLVNIGEFDETRTGWQGAKPGDNLLLVDGPFRDFVVMLKATLPGKRVDILLNLFGGVRELTVPLAWVRPA